MDGDTIRVTVKHPFYVQQVRVDLRLKDVNCPERNTPEGQVAKAFVESLLPPGTVIRLQSFEDTKGQFKKTFDRFVADVWTPGGALLQDLIVEAGRGVRV